MDNSLTQACMSRTSTPKRRRSVSQADLSGAADYPLLTLNFFRCTELRRQLYALFSTYGKVIDVVATRAEGGRGQAFVVFQNLASATAARRALEGFEFHERGLQISYAKSKSRATIVLERGPEALFDPEAMAATQSGSTSALAAASKNNKVTYSSAQADQRGREKKRQREEARQRGEKVDGDTSAEEEEEEEEEDDDDDDDVDEPKGKIRRVEPVNGTTTEQRQNGQQAVVKEESEEDDDDDAMDMGESDSDDDTPGPPAP